MEKEKFVEEKVWEIQESIFREFSPKEENIDIYAEMSELITKAAEMIYLMRKIRKKYKEEGILPVFPANSILEDMMTIVEYLDEQVVMFGRPSVIQKSYIGLPEKEVERIKKNPLDLEITGLKEWVEEGLI